MSDSNEKTTLDVDNITFEPTEDKSTDIADEKIKKLAIKLGWAEEEHEIAVPYFDAMAGIKTLDDDPMMGIKTLDYDPMMGIKTLDDDPMMGIKTLDDDPMEGIKTLDDNPMDGIKTLDDNPMDGTKTLDEDFDIFGDDLDDLEKDSYYDIEAIDPNAEEEISESEYRVLLAAQKKQKKQQEEEDKIRRAEAKAAQKVAKKEAALEKKNKKKEEARQKKLEKANFGKLRRPHINPSITVLLPTYNPERKIFVEQLRSIDAQTYENITILLLDDASEVLTKEDLMAVIPRVVTNVEVRIERNETHLGVRKTYEKLIEMADSDLVAFATQRDDWDRNKILRLVLAMEEDEDAVLAYSDARVMDEQENIIADSLLGYGLFEEFKAGKNVARTLLASNSIKLETALIKTEKLKKAVPLAPGMKVDHYIAFRMALEGKILFVGRPLLNMRLHIKHDAEIFGKRPKTDKESYIEENITSKIAGLKWIEKEVEIDAELKEALDEAIIWLMARRENMRSKENFQKDLLEGKDFAENELQFELKVAKLSPEMFELEYKKHILSLLEPAPVYIAEQRKKARNEKISKFLDGAAKKITKAFAILTGFIGKPKVRKVNTAVKRQIERKMKEEELLAKKQEELPNKGEQAND